MALSDLIGTRWVLNNQLSTYAGGTYSVKLYTVDIVTDEPTDGFNSEAYKDSFSSIFIGYNSGIECNQVRFDSTVIAYGNDTKTLPDQWQDVITIPFTITGGTDATNSALIAWLEANATQQQQSYDVTISYKGSQIATMSSSGTKTLLTSGKYCTDNIIIDYTKTGITVVETLDPHGGTIVSISGDPVTSLQAKTVIPTSQSQTISADSGYDAISEVLVQGDNNLVSSNIASGVSIFGVVGTFQGGDGGAASFIQNYGTMTSYEDSTVTTIGQGAFALCNSLQTVSFPACTIIGSSAFYSCSSLQTVSFPACTSISSYAFTFCSSLTTASFPACTNIGDYAFNTCVNLTTASFPDCTSMGSYTFYSCSSLQTASFPACTSIGSSAFYYCTSLSTVSFPACRTIGSYAFNSCVNLTTASFPACMSINAFAFNKCFNLTTASFPACRTIGSYAFNSCVNLTTASFPACMSINSYAFNTCVNLTTASFPDCTSINSYAFASCSSLTTVSFPDCINIGNYAFYLCVSLKTVSFPACTIIGGSAFYSCSSLQTVSFPACMSIRSYAFAFCSSITTVSFPSCTSINGYVFNMCANLTTASFPSCRTIDSFAFNGCRKLLSLYLTGSRVVSLHNSNAFISTPIAGYTTSTGGVYGSIFVPSSLYSTYIASTNWTYFSSRFVSV